jgi:hypothetical protein
VAFTRLQSVYLMFCLLLRLPLFVFTTRVEPKILFKRSGVIKSQIKSHQAIHDGMFSFIQLSILPQNLMFRHRQCCTTTALYGLVQAVLTVPRPCDVNTGDETFWPAMSPNLLTSGRVESRQYQTLTPL